MSREELSQSAQFSGNVRTVDVQMTRLRRKIERDPRFPALSADGARHRLCPQARLTAGADGACRARRRRRRRRQRGVDIRQRSWIKRLLPRTMFGRSLLLIVMPLVLVQLIATWVFYARHWETVSRRLSSDVAGDIGLVIEAMRSTADERRARRSCCETRPALTELDFAFEPRREACRRRHRAGGTPLEEQLAPGLDRARRRARSGSTPRASPRDI